MLPQRFATGQSSVNRKSRLEGKPSLLPKPRRPGSTDRLSTEARRPSNAGRSSSAEPARGTFGARLSREASAIKLPLNGRSRSQTSEAKYSQVPTTPLRTSHYLRPTTTPVRTPSGDRAERSWRTSLERALAFVTVKDERPISNVAWQRAECARVVEALSARGDGGGKALVRPLTITQFVNIVGDLLGAISRDSKLNNDNYVTKLPHLSKRLLYPGAVSKSWLKTVNTLHAFPHALALIAYLLDLVSDIEMPVLDEWLYVGKDELACLRREYLHKCWIRFQDPGHQFEDLNQEYLANLKLLLGNNEEKIAELKQVINKYSACLEDEAELAARAQESRLATRWDALAGALRAERARGRRARDERARQQDCAKMAADTLRALDVDIEQATNSLAEVSAAVAAQELSQAERARLLDDVDYARRVHDSKVALADQISKMVQSKETELALWQKKTLDSCVEYQQGLIHLTAQLPELAELAVDERSLMEASCGARLASAVAALRAQVATLTQRRAALARDRGARARQKQAELEESRARISELKAAIQAEHQALTVERARETEALAASAARVSAARAGAERLRERAERHVAVIAERDYWLKQDEMWRVKLAELKQYISAQRTHCAHALDAAREKRVRRARDALADWWRVKLAELKQYISAQRTHCAHALDAAREKRVRRARDALADWCARRP